MKEKIALIAVFVNFFLAVGKLFFGFISGSVAVFADGVNSASDIFASLILFFGIKISKKPVDKDHPYGHYKFEVLAGTIIMVFIFATGLYIAYDAIREFLNPSPLEVSFLVLGVMLVSALVNEIMARLKIHYGKKENSISLVADGVHSRIDVWTSLAVFVSLLVSRYWVYADVILAFAIGIYIVRESLKIGKEATDSLLDVSASDEDEKKIKDIVEEHEVRVSEMKTQKKGSVITANIKIKLPKKWSVEKANKVTDHLKKDLVDRIETLNYVAIQVEGDDSSGSFFGKGLFGEGFGWKGKNSDERDGEGPGGYCACEKCNYKIKHERGTPCSKIKCPKCEGSMRRENA